MRQSRVHQSSDPEDESTESLVSCIGDSDCTGVRIRNQPSLATVCIEYVDFGANYMIHSAKCMDNV